MRLVCHVQQRHAHMQTSIESAIKTIAAAVTG
jgi:hypothetical protein